VIFDAILNRVPVPPGRWNPEVPAELERIVTKAIEKDRELRYQGAAELRADLRRLKKEMESGRAAALSGTAAAQVQPRAEPSSDALLAAALARRHKPALLALAAVLLVALGVAGVGLYRWLAARGSETIDSVAVLPFVNASGDPEADYLSDGITESLINGLARLPNLKVMSRTSVFHYKGKTVDPREAGRQLAVRGLLVGRVLQRGESLSVSVELIDARDNRQLWGEQYNRKVADLFAVQEEIARAITEKLRVRLTGEDEKRLARRETRDPEAYQLYLRGRFYWNKRTPENLQKSLEFFQQAIERDPAFAAAQAGVADALNLLPAYGVLSPREGFAKAEAAAKRALELDDRLAEAHTSLAFVRHRFYWDWEGAERAFRRAIELNPNYSTARHWYALFLSTRGRHEEAIAQIHQAQQVDPLSLSINTAVGRIYYYARRYDAAIEQLRKVLELDANYAGALGDLSDCYEAKGMHSEALEPRLKSMTLRGEPPESVAALRAAYRQGGWPGLYRKHLELLLAQSKKGYVPAYAFTYSYLGLRDKEQSLVWLEKMVEERSGAVPFMAADWYTDFLRPDPRFQALLRRLDIPY
jgi:TolB-like protein